MKIDENALRSDLNECLTTDESVDDVDGMVAHLHLAIMTVLDKHAPIKKMPFIKARVPWMSKAIREAAMSYRKVSRLAKRNPGPDSKSEERAAMITLTSQMQLAEKTYNESIIKQKNGAKTWCAMKATTGTSQGKTKTVVSASDLNDYFGVVVNPHGVSPDIDIPFSDSETRFELQAIHPNEVALIIAKLDVKKARGPDDISALLIKMMAPVLATPLTKIMNQSIASGKFPTSWKEANITALWKGKGSQASPSNYRPISVLNVFSKIFEKVIANRLYHFAVSTGAIPPHQFAFRKGASTETALTIAVDDWLKALEHNEETTVVAVDLSKAFDVVNHQKLIHRLKAIGCSNATVTWFASFLSGRRQRVVQHGTSTPWKCVSQGVPQGSTLSPLLFSIFIGEMPDILQNASGIAFADDFTLYASGPNAQTREQIITENMARLTSYCKQMGLILNHSKTQVMTISRNIGHVQNSRSIDIGGEAQTEMVRQLSILGMLVDETLSFRSHIDRAVSRARRITGLLRSKAGHLPPFMRRCFYEAVGRSHLEYCSNVLGCASKTSLRKLQKADDDAQRMIAGQPRWSLLRAASDKPPVVKHRPCVETVSLDQRRDEHLLRTISSTRGPDAHPRLCAYATLNLPGASEGRRRVALPTRPLNNFGAKRPFYRAAITYNKFMKQKNNKQDNIYI